jgi:DNA-binding transcriptional LysR family regulator
MNIDLRHLDAFVSAARYRSFTRAARSLNISQPTFTVQIRQLETELGVRLLDRNTRSVELTRVGKDLFPVLERLMRELKSVLSSTQESAANKIGPVTVAVLPSLAATVLPRILATLKIGHPGVSVRLREAPARRIVSMITSEEVDFGIGWVKGKDSEVQFTPLFTDRMSAIFKAGSPLERKKEVTLRGLASFPLIMMDRESSVRAVVEDAFAATGNFIAPVWEATYISTALALARAGLGVTILPASVLEMDGGRHLRARPIREPDLDRRIGIIQKSGRSLSPAAEVFFQAVRTGCGDVAPGGVAKAGERLDRSPRRARRGSAPRP